MDSARLGPARLSLIVLILSACYADRSTSPSPSLFAIDSVQLQETDSLFIGQAGDLEAPGDGSYLIADTRASVIHHYARNGTRLGTIARKGTGPGEVAEGITTLALDGDSLLFLLDGMAKVLAFDYPSGAYRQTRKIPLGWSHTIAARARRVFFRHTDAASRTSVGVVDVIADSLKQGGAYPEGLGQNPVLDQLAFSVLAPLGADSIAQVFLPWDRLYIGSGSVFDTIPIAVLHRQGSRPDIVDRIARDPRTAGPDIYTPSLPMALARLENGNIAYVAADLELAQTRFTGKLHLSVIDPKKRRTCPDALVPGPTDPRGWVSLRGDTLIVLSQLVDNASASAWIHRYRIDTAGCSWLRGGTKPA